jgi:hypothetical protein
MKTFFTLSIFILTLCSCNIKYTQLYETTSSFTKDGKAVYENDTARIEYFFWDQAGVLAFAIYNKLNVPIYIDWKRSSYIKNGDKFDYWVDEQTSEYNTNYTSIQYKGLLYGWGVEGQSTTTGKTVKPERVTFIAPHSRIYKHYFILFNPSGTLLRIDHNPEVVNSKSQPGKSTVVYTNAYNKEKNPLTFRNFLTLSTSEKFDKDIYIDNEFYVSKITEMKAGEFRAGYKVINDQTIYTYPYQSDNCFYVDIDNSTAVAHRKKWKEKIYRPFYR